MVAEAQDALAVGHHDHLDRVVARVGEDVLDDVAMRKAQEQAARVARVVAELLTAFADRRRVDEGKRLLQVPLDQRVEQRLVLVLQGAQELIALEIGFEFPQSLQAAGDLLVQRADMRRQQPV